MRSNGEHYPIVPTPDPRTDPGLTADDRTVLAFLRTDISARIRPIVAHLAETDILALIEDTARIKYKYEGLGALRNTPAASAERIREKGVP